jgi:hypothetical protein
MPEIGDFIQQYRVVAMLLHTPVSNYYVVEHITRQMFPGLLVVYPVITFTYESEQRNFLQLAQEGSISISDLRLPIREAIIQGQHPYLILPYNTEIQQALVEHDRLLEQEMWSAQMAQNEYFAPEALLKEALLATLIPKVVTTKDVPALKEEGTLPLPDPEVEETPPLAPEVEVSPPPTPETRFSEGMDAASKTGTARLDSVKTSKKTNKINKVAYAVLAAILLIGLLVFGGNALRNVLSASAATISITPKALQFANDYTLYVVPNNATDTSQISGRALTFTDQQTETVAATGKGTHPANSARGTVVISQIQLFDVNSTHMLAISSISTTFGIVVTTDTEVAIPNGGSVSIPAHATPGGVASNISADSIDGPVDLIDNLTNAKIGTGFISNPSPFTGGTDAVDFQFVQSSDINGVTNAFSGQFTKDATNKVNSQIKAGEKLTHAPQCTANMTANHQANDEAADVTVKVSVTCSALAYTEQAIHDAAMKRYHDDGINQYGKGFVIVGNPVVSPITPGSSDGSYSINIRAIWSYLYTPAGQQEIKQLIAGKTQDDALKMLQQRSDIRSVAIKTEGWSGAAIPEKLENIHLVIGNVSGLKV